MSLVEKKSQTLALEADPDIQTAPLDNQLTDSLLGIEASPAAAQANPPVAPVAEVPGQQGMPLGPQDGPHMAKIPAAAPSQTSLEVMLPMTSAPYAALSQGILSALTVASTPTTPSLSIVDAAPTDTLSIDALLAKKHTQFVLGPLVTQQILGLFAQSKEFSTTFLALNANPIFRQYPRPKNVWFVPPSVAQELALVRTLRQPDESASRLAIVLPSAQTHGPLRGAFKLLVDKATEIVTIDDLGDIASDAVVYLPLKLEGLTDFGPRTVVYGSAWYMAPNSPVALGAKSYKITPEVEFDPTLLMALEAALNRRPTATEVWSIVALQLAQQMITSDPASWATRAYTTPVGPVTMGADGYAVYNLVLQSIHDASIPSE